MMEGGYSWSHVPFEEGEYPEGVYVWGEYSGRWFPGASMSRGEYLGGKYSGVST